MISFRPLWICTAVCLVCSIFSVSQTTPVGQDKAHKVQDATFDASQTSSTSSPSTQVTLEGTKDDATGKARVGVQLGDLILEVKASVPIKKGDTEADLASLDGLANKSTVDFGSTWVKWNPSASAESMKQICTSRLIDEKKAASATEAEGLLLETDSSGEPKYPCTLQSMPVGSKYRTQFRDAVKWGTPVLLTARYSMSREEFKFALPPAFASQKETHSSYGATAAVGVITDKIGLIQLSYQYQSSYKAQDSKNVCTPVTGSTSSVCSDIAVGAPGRTIKNILQLETRTFFGKSFGLGPIVSGDLRSRTAAVKLPIYVLKSKDGGLNGGLSIGWKSGTNAFTATVFVGDVLTLLSK